MPYDFGNAWGQIGADLGAKIAGRPSAREAKDADRALAIKMAQDKSDYEKEQDSNKNFIATGGYNIDQLRAGAQEAALMGNGSEESFKANMANPGNMVMRNEYQNPSSNLKAYMGFQDKMAKKYEGKLSLEDRIAFENITSANKIKLKETQGGGTKDNWAGMGAGGSAAEPLEDKTDYNGPAKLFDWSTWGRGTKPTGNSAAPAAKGGQYTAEQLAIRKRLGLK